MKIRLCQKEFLHFTSITYVLFVTGNNSAMEKELIDGLKDLVSTLQVDCEFLKDVSVHISNMSTKLDQQTIMINTQKQELENLRESLRTALEDLANSQKEVQALTLSVEEHVNSVKQRSCFFCRLTQSS